ncbi:hypothetical protein FDZ63_01230 [Ehrlichia ruminantium]|nr:hypothetical protein FDZ65_01235 [Ehrlichia ruminantium]QLK54659.1 hypothetical protein FDZ63_01230 [Ehrlichia ruminantium]QLK57409.1 hypothetical protein FDZ60_01230 [Ehrlichia ruminantium]
MINTLMSITLEKILKEILGKTPSFYFNNTIDIEVFFHKVNKPQIYNRYKRIIAQYTNLQSVTITHVDHAVLLFYICSKLTKNPQEEFLSFILACHESYNDYVKFRYKSKFLQQLSCMANTLKNLIYLQFYANAQWTDRPEPLIEKLNMFDNLRILSLSNITQPKLSTYTNTKETLSFTGVFANSKIEYLFLNCYPLRIIRYFPKLKFLQISNKIYDSTIQKYTLDLHKYFHPNAITLNTLSLINTKIIGNNAIYHHPKHNFRVIYNLRNIKIKKGGITNNMYSVKLQTHYNTTLDNISLNTYAYQFIHSIHLQKYNNTTLILLDKSQSSETIKQITQSVPNYTLINIQLNTVPYKFNEYHCRNTAQAQPIIETIHDHSHDITTSSTTSAPDISSSNNVSLPNVTPDPQQAHVNIKDNHASHSSTTCTTTLQASDNDSSRINLPKAKSDITIDNLHNTQDNNSHNLATFSTTSAPDISSSNNVSLPNVTPDPQQAHVNIKDDHASHSSTTCTTTLQASGNDSNRTSPHSTDIIRSDLKFDKTSDHDTADNLLRFPTILTLNYSNPNNTNLYDTNMDVADDQDYSPFHQFSLPITENMSTDSSDNDTAFDSLPITEGTSADLSEEDSNVEFYVNQIIQDQNLDLSLITNYVLKSPDITHISYNIEISTPEYTILDNISSNISIPQQEPTTKGNPMKKINRLPTNTTKNNAYIANHQKVEQLLINNVSTASSLHNTQSTEDPYNSSFIPTIKNYSPSIANRENITKQSFQGKQQTNNLLITEHRVISSQTTRTTYFQHIPCRPTSTQTNEFQSLNALSVEELISIYLDEEESDLQLDTISTNEENQQTDHSYTKRDDTINSNMTNTSTTTYFEQTFCQPTLSQINEFQLINSSSIEEFKKNYLDQEDINQPISTSIEGYQSITTNTALKISSMYHHASLQDSLSSNTPLDLTNNYIPRPTCPPSPSYKMRISHKKMPITPYSRPTQQNLLRR